MTRRGNNARPRGELNKLTTKVTSFILRPSWRHNVSSRGIAQKLHLPKMQEDVFEMSKAPRGSKEAFSDARLARDFQSKRIRGKSKPLINVKLHNTRNGFVCRLRVQPELIYPGNPRRYHGFVRELRRGPIRRERVCAQAAVKFGDGLLKISGQQSDCLCVNTEISSELQMTHVNVGRGIGEVSIGNNFYTFREGRFPGKDSEPFGILRLLIQIFNQ